MAKATILLVQYAQTRGNGTRRSLENAGYDVLWAGSGMSALAVAGAHNVDVVLLDVALPDVEGADLCRRFRSQPDIAGIPIIMLNAREIEPGSFANREEAPDDYLAKPYTEGELVARISSALRTGELRRELEKKDKLLASAQASAGAAVVVDPVTGLFGKQQFEAMLAKEFKRAVRFKQQMSCMLIDLDGHEMGRFADETLVKAIIALVQQTIREVDTAAWWTGGEFIVLLPNTIKNDAVQAAARVLEAVAVHPFTWPDATQVTMSIGVAGLPDKAIDSEQKLIAAAAAACKRARELMISGRPVPPRRKP